MKYIINAVRTIFLGLFLYLMFTQRTTIWLGIFAVSLILAIFFGRLYCGYVCPMNTVMTLKEKILKKGKRNAPKWLESKKLPWLFLIVSVIVMILSKRTGKVNIPILFIWLGISFVVSLFYKPEVFHNYICPFGILQRMAGKISFFSKRVTKDKCIGCKKCEKACPAEAIEIKENDSRAIIYEELCHQCEQCSVVCPTGAITYRKK